MSNGNFDRNYKASKLKAAIATLDSYARALNNPKTDAAGREWCLRDWPRAKQEVETAKRMTERWWE